MTSRDVGERRGGRARPLLSAVAPGVPQLLRGRIGAGSLALLLWATLLVVLVARWARVAAAPSGPWDARVALVALVAALACTAGWSLHEDRAAWSERAGARSFGQWGVGWHAFLRNRVAVAGLVTIAAFYLAALLTPFLAPFDPDAQGSLITERMIGPSFVHLLGTDQFARDVLSRLLYGARVSLSIGFVAVGIAVTIGTVLGAVSGYLGGKVDAVLMRFVDMVISFPRLVLLIAIIAFFEPSMVLIMAILGLTQWPSTTRIVRGEVLSLREREFVQAGKALGFSSTRLVFRHVIPNTLAPLIVAATLGIGDTIVLEAGLSFLGLGVQPPTPSWGTMVADGRDNLLGAWWISTFAGLAIVLTVLAFNLAGDGLRDALDPRLRS
jgi:peptide/nickel transport system permease protein